MKLLTSPESLRAEIIRLTRSYRHFDWAVAWASAGHKAFDSLDKYRKKIRRIVVGTHFHQTAPDFIDRLADVPAVRYRLDQDGLNGVFHPKLYLFSNDKSGLGGYHRERQLYRGRFQQERRTRHSNRFGRPS